jgi:hypothetical protein
MVVDTPAAYLSENKAPAAQLNCAGAVRLGLPLTVASARLALFPTPLGRWLGAGLNAGQQFHTLAASSSNRQASLRHRSKFVTAPIRPCDGSTGQVP